MSGHWRFVRSTPLRSMGKLTLREDRWLLPSGAERAYPVLHVGACVAVVPRLDAEHVVLVRQFRHLPRADSWELPGGGALPGERIEDAAQRELREEGGYRAARLTFLTRFLPSPAYLDEEAHCFLGEDLTADPLPSDDDEFFERRVFPLREAVMMALSDGITESVSKVALLAAALRLGVRP
ncbi:MAG TPA: NUDIX hydrolase [Methylomirabilota bacterium]|nr:NUDIX hydrolase [Methylomirabilota bacterium]